MAYVLKNRDKQIPNGFRFVQPQVPNWSPRVFSSFTSTVQQIIALRQGNPQWKAATDVATVSGEVDLYNAALCHKMGWHEYVQGVGDDLPKYQPRPEGRATALLAGANILKAWLGEGGKPVSQELADARAKICTTGGPNGSSCPQNQPETWQDIFTVQAAAVLEKMIEARNKLKLETPHDFMLGVCDACLCPMKLKVWCPESVMKDRIPANQISAMPDFCWVKKEINNLRQPPPS